MARQWILNSQEGFEVSLEYQEDVQVPSEDKLGPNEVLVKMHAASLNYREIILAGPGALFGPIKPSVIPACDGAGVVEAVGSSVQDFQPGDRVVTHAAPKLVESSGDNACPSLADAPLMLGQGSDGTLRSKGAFPETALVHAPRSLGWLPASTLTCTWLTAWNELFGLQGQEARPGSWVLVQGTGGVSVATLQLAVAAGITVVATTSTEDKAARLQSLGAKHTVNYRSNPNDWGREARSLTPGEKGFDMVVDVGGDESLSQSLAAVRVGGTVLLVGAVGENAEPLPMSAAFLHTCIVRGVLAGSRAQFRELVRFIDEKNIKPAVDDVVFELAEAKDAYKRLKEKKHFSKVSIRIDHPSA
ncbi:putative alcohol dehydrogenase [Xylariales sp. AK1849]|nr:putative alcohol dehydrogenase [Xylariales sp. AK1849]